MQKELRVGLDFSAPIPLHTDISTGVFEGFEVDLIKELSGRLDVKLIYEVSLWKDILQKLQQGQLDIICSAVTITTERRSFLAFSIPYLTFRVCAVSRKENNIHSISEFHQKRIGVRKATEAEKYANTKEANITLSDTNEELYQLLKKGKIDLVIDDSPIAMSSQARTKLFSNHYFVLQMPPQ